MLAVAWGLRKAQHWVQGCLKLVVAIDHKPLLGILRERDLEKIENPRLLALKEKNLPFNFKTIHLPGRKNDGVDAASRHPAGRPDHVSIGAMQERGKMPGLGRTLVRSRYLALMSEYLQQQVNIGLRVAFWYAERV